MTVLRISSIFLLAVVGELSGAYAIWQWRREGGAAWLIPVGLGALFAYALIQTFQPDVPFGRLYAAYAGVFLLGAMTWGWLFDGLRPDRADLAGAALVLIGVVVILFARQPG